MRGLLNESSHFFGMRDVNRVAGSLCLDFVAVRAHGVHSFQIGIYGLVVLGHHVPARFQLPSGVGDRRREHLGGGWHLGLRHELGLRGWQIRGEVFGEVSRIKQEEAIGRFDQRPAYSS
jgi:hypothetical protein